MKHNCVIRAAKGTQGGWLILDKIECKGRELIVTKDMRVIERGLRIASDEPFMQHISPEKSYVFTFDDSPQLNDEKNNHRMRMGEVIQYHPQVLTDGFRNPNLGIGVVFEFEDIAKTDVRNFKVLAMCVAATNKVWNMSYQEKVDTMFFYGENPTGMGHREITMRLVEPNFGVVLRKTQFGMSDKTYLEHFVENYDGGDTTNRMKTIILKAMYILKDGRPILRREGTAYMFGEKVCGSSIEEVMAWFVSQPQLKDFIEKQVMESDTLLPDDMDDVTESSVDVVAEISKVVDEKALRDYAKKLRIDNWHNRTVETLIEKIAEAEKIWAKVDLYGLRQRVESTKNIMLYRIKQLVDEKEKELEAV